MRCSTSESWAAAGNAASAAMPIWGIFVSRGSPLAVPTLEILGAVAVLPVLAIGAAWLLSRPIPDWNAFRSGGAGE
jgi:hypothetical protein